MSLDTTINVLTLPELKSYIEGSTTSSTAQDENYNQLINGMSAFFNLHCDYTLKFTSYTTASDETDFDGNGTAYMYLNHIPVSTTGIVVYVADDARLFTTDTIEATSNIIINYKEGRVVLYNALFKSGHENIRVFYSAGYSSSAMPADLKIAAKEWCQFYWNRQTKKDRVGLRSESFEGGSRTFETDMPWSVKKLLEHYRRSSYG